MDADLTPSEYLAGGGFVAVAVGTVLPWIVAAPGADAVIEIYVPGMEWGLSAPDYLVLAVLAGGLVQGVRHRDARRGGSFVAAAGGAVVVWTTGWLVETLLLGPASLGAFVPGPGAVVTLLGGLLLVAGGWRHATNVAEDPLLRELQTLPGWSDPE